MAFLKKNPSFYSGFFFYSYYLVSYLIISIFKASSLFNRVKKTLFAHPFVAKYFTHISRTVVWKNNNNITVFIKFSFFCILFHRLKAAPEVYPTNNPSFLANSCCVSTFFIRYFDKFINNIKISCRWN